MNDTATTTADYKKLLGEVAGLMLLCDPQYAPEPHQVEQMTQIIAAVDTFASDQQKAIIGKAEAMTPELRRSYLKAIYQPLIEDLENRINETLWNPVCLSGRYGWRFRNKVIDVLVARECLRYE